MSHAHITTLRGGFSLLLFMTLVGCAAPPSPSIITNVPSARLANDTYVSPDGEYSVKLPALIKPGARIDELQTNPVAHGVFFADDLGKVYSILRTDNSRTRFTLEQVSDNFKVGDLLREKQFATTDRGKVLRLLGINKERSPIVTRTKEKGEWIQRKNDLYEAWSIFMRDAYIYQVTAGVTALENESENVLLDRAKKNLNGFLKSLSIKPTK
ncbi:MAG: hypothetical protein ACREJN_19880 [Nitrospiraceae bacterium]